MEPGRVELLQMEHREFRKYLKVWLARILAVEAAIIEVEGRILDFPDDEEALDPHRDFLGSLQKNLQATKGRLLELLRESQPRTVRRLVEPAPQRGFSTTSLPYVEEREVVIERSLAIRQLRGIAMSVEKTKQAVQTLAESVEELG